MNSNDVEDERFSNMDIITQNQNISNQNMYLNSEITEQEINYCINNLKNSKAASPFNNIINEYIKSTKHLILPLYYKLFNCVLETSFIPTTWLEGAIIPIFENNGDQNDPFNYRPITILSCLGKL